MATRKAAPKDDSKAAAHAVTKSPPKRAVKAAPPKPVDGFAVLERAGKGQFPTSLYVEGPDEALKAAFLAGFRRAWGRAVPESPVPHLKHPSEDSVDDVLAAYQSVSMFAPRECTIVLDVEDYARSEKRVAALAEGVTRPAGESCIVIVESAADKPRKALDALKGACSAYWNALTPNVRDLQRWGELRLAAESVTAEAGTLEALAKSCENRPEPFFNELGKLIASASGKGRVTQADLARLARPTIDADREAWLFAVAQGNPALAAKLLGRLLTEGEDEGGLLFSLSNMVGGSMGGWSLFRAQSGALGARIKPAGCARALDAVYRAEAAWKGGRVDAVLALELATREVASA